LGGGEEEGETQLFECELFEGVVVGEEVEEGEDVAAVGEVGGGLREAPLEHVAHQTFDDVGVDVVVVVDVLVVEQVAHQHHLLLVFHQPREVDEEGEFVVVAAVHVVLEGLDFCEDAVALGDDFGALGYG
jgi:hypothetical protein